MNKLSFLALLICVLSNVAWAYDFKERNLCYDWNDDGITVRVTFQQSEQPTYPLLKGELDVPANVVYYDGLSYSVVGISNLAFAGCSQLSRVNIPNSVKYRPMGHFAG